MVTIYDTLATHNCALLTGHASGHGFDEHLGIVVVVGVAVRYQHGIQFQGVQSELVTANQGSRSRVQVQVFTIHTVYTDATSHPALGNGGETPPTASYKG